jgi:hypothetical protein
MNEDKKAFKHDWRKNNAAIWMNHVLCAILLAFALCKEVS